MARKRRTNNGQRQQQSKAEEIHNNKMENARINKKK